MGELKKWIKQNSKFLKLADGETITAAYLGFKFVQSSFDSDKETVRYTLMTSEGEKLWDTSSKVVADFFDKVTPEGTVKIKRLGEGRDTEYVLSVVKDPEDTEVDPFFRTSLTPFSSSKTALFLPFFKIC